ADTAAPGSRYSLLETMRAYAFEKLVESDDVDARKRRHARYVRDFFESAPGDWLRRPDAAWHAKYEPMMADIRAALEWALDADGDGAIGVSLAGSAGVVLASLGLFAEGVQWS